VLARVRTHIALAEQKAKLKALPDQLSPYLSPQIYRAIFEGAQDSAIRASRKKLTVYFSDIKDFTDTTEKHGAGGPHVPPQQVFLGDVDDRARARRDHRHSSWATRCCSSSAIPRAGA
jgi:hypothetical protein